MNEQDYWNLIAASRGSDERSHLESQISRLKESLNQLTEPELLEYERISLGQYWQAYKHDLFAFSLLVFHIMGSSITIYGQINLCGELEYGFEEKQNCRNLNPHN